MKKITIVIQLVLVCFLYNTSIYAVSEFDEYIIQLKDKDKDVRYKAATSLSFLDNERAVIPLIAALKDENAGVRMEVVFSLGKLKDKRAVLPLITALKDDKEKRVRREAAKALGVLKDKRAVVPLIAALNDKDSEGRSSVRVRAVIALGELNDKRAVVPLTQVSTSENIYERIQAKNALEKLLGQ